MSQIQLALSRFPMGVDLRQAQSPLARDRARAAALWALATPLGPWLGLCRLSEANWPEKIISLYREAGRRNGRMRSSLRIAVITGGFYEVVMGPESIQPSLSFCPSLVTYSWGRGSIN